VIIAIDGPAASGKGTLGKKLAAHYGLRHLDSGLLYRAVAKAVLDSGFKPDDRQAAMMLAKSLDLAHLNEAALKTPKVGEAASIISAFPEVRAALVAFQREFAAKPPGAVLDGRDIGTVVCPDADAKLFITATLEARARRRFKELQENVGKAIYERVLQDMKDRDARDSQRRAAPLVPAGDAFVLDTTALDADAAFAAALDFIGRKLAGKPPRKGRS
jgi:CMP/dCMP kinase